MPLTATPSRRRLAMAALLLLAVAGLVIRNVAPDPSTLHDVGTLLLVLWLPAVGNLLAYLIRKIPRRPRPLAGVFPARSVFTPHVHVRLEPTGLVPDLPSALVSAGNRCTLIVGNSGFSARIGGPLPGQEGESVAVELLRPAVALGQLTPGTEFRLLVGEIAAAKGRVLGVA